MYSKYETPLFEAALFYYDYDYSQDVSRDVERILKEHSFFPPDKIYAGVLTHNRYRSFSKLREDYFVRAYSEPDVLGVSMASGDSRKVKDFWKIDWSFTFYKCSDVDVSQTAFKPWNVLFLKSTYGRLQEIENREALLSCVRDLIVCLHPFYAELDDIDNAAKYGGGTFRPFEKRPALWGNYWGSEYCKLMHANRLLDLPNLSVTPLCDGLFFTLTDNLMDCSSPQCAEQRKMINRFI